MGRAERVMRMFYELSSEGGFISRDRVLDEYGITERQFRRDIEYIRDRIISPLIGSNEVDIKCFRYEGRSYYKLIGDIKALTEYRSKSAIAEAVASSALDPIRRLLDDNIEHDSKRKIPIPKRRYVKFLSQASELPDYSLFSTLLGAIEKERCIEIEYCKIGKEPFFTKVEPLELINYSAIWYLRGYNIKLEALRTYSLSRIKHVELLEEKIMFKSYEELEKLDNSGFGIFVSNSTPKDYVIRFSGVPAYIVSNQIWHVKQRGRWVDNEIYELTIPATNVTELLGKTLSFGSDAWPVAPEEFVLEYKKKVEEMARLRL